MNPHLPPRLLLASTILGILSATTAAAAPNVIIILADDLGYGDPQCYNAAFKIPTPHIDSLAQRGLRFTDAHTPPPSSVTTATPTSAAPKRIPMKAVLASALDKPLPAGAAPDGHSIMPILNQPDLKTPTRPVLAHHSLRGMFAVRAGPWKLVIERGSGGFSLPRTLKAKPGEPKGQLYHLYDDPAETKNVYLDHPEVVEALSASLEAIRARD